MRLLNLNRSKTALEPLKNCRCPTQGLIIHRDFLEL